MDKENLKKWMDKIDEAKSRQAYGDLSNIAYQLIQLLAKTCGEKDKPKDINEPRCVDCGRSPYKGVKCDLAYRGANCREWWVAHLSSIL